MAVEIMTSRYSSLQKLAKRCLSDDNTVPGGLAGRCLVPAQVCGSIGPGTPQGESGRFVSSGVGLRRESALV